jgi:hypothetical protein
MPQDFYRKAQKTILNAERDLARILTLGERTDLILDNFEHMSGSSAARYLVRQLVANCQIGPSAEICGTDDDRPEDRPRDDDCPACRR